MKSFHDIILQFQIDMEEEIPPLIVTKGLPDVSEYVFGEPRKAEEMAIGIYASPYSESVDNENITMFFQLQLYGVKYEDALVYAQVVTDYLKVYSPSRIGASLREDVTTDIFPPDENDTIFVIISARFSHPLDSCDGGI